MNFYWKLENRWTNSAPQGWDKTSGYFYQYGVYTNTLAWLGGVDLTNREFVVRAWYDEDADQELDETESRRSVYVRVMDKVEADQLVFVPVNSSVSLDIMVEPAIDYSLIISRERGSHGLAAFADGTTTQRVHGSTNVVIRGTEICCANNHIPTPKS